MDTKNREELFRKYIEIIKKFIVVVTVLIALFFFVGELVLPDERQEDFSEFKVFEAEWERVLEDGSRVPVEIPAKLKAEPGEVVTLSTTLPQQIENGKNICFRVLWQNAEVYIGGKLRQKYNTENSRPFGTNSTSAYVFVELNDTDAGEELIYQFSSKSKYAGDMRECYIGDKAGIWTQLIKKSGSRIVIAVFLMLLSLFCALVCGILKIVYKKSLALNYLSWTVFFCTFWMVSEIECRQLIFRNVSVLSSYPYWCLMLIPISLILYINDVQKDSYKKVYILPLTYTSALLLISTVLQIFDIVQFVQMLTYVHIGIAISVIVILATITVDTVKKRISEYLFVGIGVYGMLLTAILELVVYYVGTKTSLGTILLIGLLFLLIMAIIKTGQDLFQTEKNRQQAIMAKEAQAKFLANMSHEIRTPINAVVGMNEMILRESENEAVLGYAHNIQSASTMLLGLVNDILDFSKIESGQLELVEDNYHLATLIQDEILLLNARAAEKPISTQIDIDPRLPSTYFGDELRIKQVLTNLLSNAVKYTKEGTVTLKASFRWLGADSIELSFSIIDTGIGIRQEDLSKLFSSFKRLELKKNRNIEGTGLGLNIAKQLVDLMKGTITVESEYGKGSTFTVSIPQKVVDKQSIGNFEEFLQKYRKEKIAATKFLTAPSARILIVDDNSMNLSVIKGLLKRTKVDLDLATSGKECLELTKKKKYNVILMDHMMPELDGVETLHILREDHFNQNQNTIVVALTANAVSGCREMYLGYGFNDYLAKPVQAAKLDAMLMEYLPDELIKMVEPLAVEGKEANESMVSNTQVLETDVLYIDKNEGLSYCLNSEEFYKKTLSIFHKQCKEYVPQLDIHFKDENWEQYTIIVHALKGTALNIGAINFSNLSLQHEMAGKEVDTAFIKEGYPSYINTLKEMIKVIEKML